MAFNEISFLFAFLPVVLLLHWVMPTPGRNILLLVVSLVFFAWGSTEYMVLMVLLILFNYFSGLQIAEKKAEKNKKGASRVLTSAVVVDLLLLGFFKYWGFLLGNVNALLRTHFAVRDLPSPMGISFFTFSILSYLYDVYRDKAPAAKNILDFSLFVTFFPKLVSGPIVQYTAMAEQIRHRTVNAGKFGSGARLFLIGLAKKVLLANTIGTTFYAITGMALNNVSVVSAWLGAVSYSLMLYFDFSGYSDMAIGLAAMFGFVFDRNFDYPYMADSITDFWRRWHISLGAWFRDYVYIPLGGSRAGKSATIRNLLIVWLLTGVWHGASWNFIFWGLYYGGLLLLEKFFLKSLADAMPRVLKHFFTLLLVIIGWVFFFSPGLGSAFVWLSRMFGIGGPGLLDSAAKYYFAGSWKILLIGILAAYPLGVRFTTGWMKRSPNAAYVTAVYYAVLLFFVIAGMVSGTYSSFLYFQF